MSRLELAAYKLADTLGMTLEFEANQSSGEGELTWEVSAGQELKFPLRLDKAFFGEQIGAIIHVLGDLYLMASYFPKTASMSFYVIDGSKLLLDGVVSPPRMFVSKTMDLRSVMAVIGKAVVKGYYWKNNEWKPLALK